MVIILMGVAGSGKSTVGKLLAAELDWEFIEGDALHPKANIDKMAGGTPLTDDDRLPWLHVLQKQISGLINSNRNALIACSALKKMYRDLLREPHREVSFVYLQGDADRIRQRLAGRERHYMKADLLASQLAALEEPVHALTVDIEPAPEQIVRQIIGRLALKKLTGK